jgi:hypothetical protein
MTAATAASSSGPTISSISALVTMRLRSAGSLVDVSRTHSFAAAPKQTAFRQSLLAKHQLDHVQEQSCREMHHGKMELEEGRRVVCPVIVQHFAEEFAAGGEMAREIGDERAEGKRDKPAALVPDNPAARPRPRRARRWRRW